MNKLNFSVLTAATLLALACNHENDRPMTPANGTVPNRSGAPMDSTAPNNMSGTDPGDSGYGNSPNGSNNPNGTDSTGRGSTGTGSTGTGTPGHGTNGAPSTSSDSPAPGTPGTGSGSPSR